MADSNGTIKLVAVLPEGGKSAKEPRYLNCAENALELRELLKDKAEVIVTSDKDGDSSGHH